MKGGKNSKQIQTEASQNLFECFLNDSSDEKHKEDLSTPQPILQNQISCIQGSEQQGFQNLQDSNLLNQARLNKQVQNNIRLSGKRSYAQISKKQNNLKEILQQQHKLSQMKVAKLNKENTEQNKENSLHKHVTFIQERNIQQDKEKENIEEQQKDSKEVKKNNLKEVNKVNEEQETQSKLAQCYEELDKIKQIKKETLLQEYYEKNQIQEIHQKIQMNKVPQNLDSVQQQFKERMNHLYGLTIKYDETVPLEQYNDLLNQIKEIKKQIASQKSSLERKSQRLSVLKQGYENIQEILSMEKQIEFLKKFSLISEFKPVEAQSGNFQHMVWAHNRFYVKMQFMDCYIDFYLKFLENDKVEYSFISKSVSLYPLEALLYSFEMFPQEVPLLFNKIKDQIQQQQVNCF